MTRRRCKRGREEEVEQLMPYIGGQINVKRWRSLRNGMGGFEMTRRRCKSGGGEDVKQLLPYIGVQINVRRRSSLRNGGEVAV